MATGGFGFEPSRNLLSQAIVEVLQSWPELQRRVFVETHYHGRPVEEVSLALALCPGEVTQILQHCERKLFRALKAFRDGTPAVASEEPPHSLDYAVNCCCH
jgi:DNA-directed RNA polymerase specialized sigma24 family protein